MEIRSRNANEDERWYAALRAGAAEGRLAPLIVSQKALLTSLRTNDSNPGADRRAFGAWDGEVCLGTALLAMPRRDNLRSAELDINVVPAYRGRGIGAALFDHAIAVAGEHGRTTITDEINVPIGQSLESSPGGRFALARGLTGVHTEQRLMLDLPGPTVDAPAPEDYRAVSWLGSTPTEFIDAFAQMYTLMDRDAPSGELDREPTIYDVEWIRRREQRQQEQGYGLVTTLVVKDGEPAAYTKMFVSAEREERSEAESRSAGAHVSAEREERSEGAHVDAVHVLQDDTFVLRAHRGQRLGAHAKLVNLRQLTENYPDVRHVHTWTAEVNDAMRAINERFGFRAVETTHMVKGIMA